jgi:hypothetical protein
MQGYELAKKIREEKGAHPDRIFIKLWRKEEDYIDFDLVSRFLDNLSDAADFGGFELIDQDEMWKTIERRCDGRASKVQREGRSVLLWTAPKGAEAEEKIYEYPDTPESLLKILDLETDFNYVD